MDKNAMTVSAFIEYAKLEVAAGRIDGNAVLCHQVTRFANSAQHSGMAVAETCAVTGMQTIGPYYVHLTGEIGLGQ